MTFIQRLDEEKPQSGTKATSVIKPFDAHGKSQLKRDQTLDYTELASKGIKRIALGENKSSCIARSNKLDISGKNRPVKDKTSLLMSTPCTRDNISLKRSLQQSVPESPKDKNVVSQHKKMKTHQKVPQKQESSKSGKRLDSPRTTVKKDTLKQPSKNNGANKGPILVANKEPILVGNDGSIMEGNDGPILEESLENTNISAKAADHKHGIYRLCQSVQVICLKSSM
ncbi:hypothetical protein OS493_008818 [Desmophyllum pertusum]|uniref:Uncharacterized protein n=1 Tax=Desmophyllum pertusum TaxID=174260 RepID=A0A9X0CYM9_9CNID|nr:hypothetical protein OS493_008818 [Desmophyllum pertusum]